MTVTGSRADYGLIHNSVLELRKDWAVDLIVIGDSPMLRIEGPTAQIDRTLFRNIYPIEVPFAALAEGASMQDGFAAILRASGQFLRAAQPRLFLAAGDRWEIFATVMASFFAQVPIAHLAGGDVTMGSYDEHFRTCITQFSKWHLTTNSEATARLKKICLHPEMIFQVGSPSIDHLAEDSLLSTAAIEAVLKIKLPKNFFLVNFQPQTVSPLSPLQQIQTFLQGLSKIHAATELVWALPNMDLGASEIQDAIFHFTKTRPGVHAYTALPRNVYLSLLKRSIALLGNSSSGIYEAPALGVPALNVGDRQKGRLMASSVICCPLEIKAMQNALHSLDRKEKLALQSPYGDGQSALRMREIFKAELI